MSDEAKAERLGYATGRVARGLPLVGLLAAVTWCAFPRYRQMVVIFFAVIGVAFWLIISLLLWAAKRLS